MRLLPGARAITPARHDRMPYRVFLAQIGERLRNAYEGRANGYENARAVPRRHRADRRRACRPTRARNAGLFYVRAAAAPDRHLRLSPGDARCAPARERAAPGDRAGLRRSGAGSRAAPRAARAAGAGAGEGSRARASSSMRSASARSRCSTPSCRAGIATARRPSAISSSAAPAARTTCWRRCCWRAGRRPTTSAPARWRSTSRRSSRAVAALERCGDMMQELLADPLYRRHLEAHGRRQCVLIGYSDSNKESGACASRFAIHQAQRDLAQRAGRRRRAARPVPRPRRQHRAWRRPHRSARARRARRGGRTACCASASRARRSSRATGCAPSPCARSSAPSTRSASPPRRCAAASCAMTRREQLQLAALLAQASRAAYRRLVYGERAVLRATSGA